MPRKKDDPLAAEASTRVVYADLADAMSVVDAPAAAFQQALGTTGEKIQQFDRLHFENDLA